MENKALARCAYSDRFELRINGFLGARMANNTFSDHRSFATEVLSLQEDAVEFVHTQIAQRKLTKTVAALNKELLYGDASQKAQAKQALEKLGFM